MLKKSLLKQLQKPGRYLGTEINTSHKKRKRHHISVCLAFPDLYEIGMSHQGIQILYSIINALDTATCERVFAPARDLEELLRKKKVPLSSLESNTALHKFDVIGFSLSYELCYTNIFTILDCSTIPFKSEDRPSWPLVIAGGPASVNPEILADFIDLFVIGDGEEVIKQIIALCAQHKKKHKQKEKEKLLCALSTLEGVYIPRLFKKGPAHAIQKISLRSLDQAPYPTKPIVPYIQTVHDRACVEIMRGCPHQCKFCQARHFYHPVRLREANTIKELAQKILAATGHDELSLLSLSSGDYPHIESLIKDLSQSCSNNRVALSFPSIRVEKLITILPYYLSQTKKTGLTFAPEAGSERLRRFIGKNINIDYLKESTLEAYTRGYQHIKLYFMIGLPTETREDLDGIVKLVYELAKMRMQVAKKPAQINVNIGTFIPKPHTAFEREKMDSVVLIQEKQNYLKEKFKKRYIKYHFTPAAISVLEGAFARGDRRMGDVITRAWHKGARFDAWKEHFNADIWKRAFEEKGIDLEQYATRQIEEGEILPWGHITL
ncbi:MAG: TIGR03960 family B12-binding radical SAM protein [Candidatus Omnitrophica bacterium]|nr:TIGR03960 family B12-binding radical SAM protein [Candidatus Omnitrophota bacterium]